VEALAARGVAEKTARRLLFGLAEDVDVQEQIEWIDSIIGKDPRKFGNPSGMYVSFIRDSITPPADFVSSRRRKELQAAELDRRTSEASLAGKRFELDMRYSEYQEEQVHAYIGALTADAKTTLTKNARKAAGKHVSHFDALTPEQQAGLISRFEFNIVVGEIQILTKEEFQSREQFQQLSFSSSMGR
jgi:hypothetical protein